MDTKDSGPKASDPKTPDAPNALNDRHAVWAARYRQMELEAARQAANTPIEIDLTETSTFQDILLDRLDQALGSSEAVSDDDREFFAKQIRGAFQALASRKELMSLDIQREKLLGVVTDRLKTAEEELEVALNEKCRLGFELARANHIAQEADARAETCAESEAEIRRLTVERDRLQASWTERDRLLQEVLAERATLHARIVRWLQTNSRNLQSRVETLSNQLEVERQKVRAVTQERDAAINRLSSANTDRDEAVRELETVRRLRDAAVDDLAVASRGLGRICRALREAGQHAVVEEIEGPGGRSFREWIEAQRTAETEARKALTEQVEEIAKRPTWDKSDVWEQFCALRSLLEANNIIDDE